MMWLLEDDDIIPTDIYVNQENYHDVDTVDNLECYVTSYDTPSVDLSPPSSRYASEDDDHAHLVFNVPRLERRY
tara:strand:+ start:1444 stop:1665 length:222 start_codon:yes stop_codon:yes gene_type:complete